MKTINIKKLFAIALISLPVSLFAQDATEAVLGPEVVKATFENGFHINNQTTQTIDKGYVDFIIQHRFGVIDKPKDLYGIYAPSNVRLFIGYGITQRLSVGFSPTKNKQLYDFSAKYKALRQMTSGMPVTVTLYGNACIKGGDQKFFKSGAKAEYTFGNRMSYFGELMVSRKFNGKFSAQLGFNYAHYSLVDSSVSADISDYLGISALAKYKFSPQGSILLEFDQPLNVSNIPVGKKPLPNLGIGVEFSTGYHQFQVFICNSSGLLDQESKFFNFYELGKFDTPNYLIGFNFTRQFGFGE